MIHQSAGVVEGFRDIEEVGFCYALLSLWNGFLTKQARACVRRVSDMMRYGFTLLTTFFLLVASA